MDSGTGEPLSIEQVSAALEPFGDPLSDAQLRSITDYVSLLCFWNRRVSLTAITDPIEIVIHHFGESIFARRLLRSGSGRLADVGTGAGFPGLALKIARPELRVTLLEPNHKKIAFLKELLRCRFEDLTVSHRTEDQFAYICSRAMGSYKSLLGWARQALAVDGNLILWVGENDSIRLVRTPGWNWSPPVLIPGSKRRLLVSGSPIRQ